jgi:hypothetical protein
MKIRLPCVPYDLVGHRPRFGDDLPAGTSVARRAAEALPLKLKPVAPGAGTGAAARRRNLLERTAGEIKGGARPRPVRSSSAAEEVRGALARGQRRPLSGSGYKLPAPPPRVTPPLAADGGAAGTSAVPPGRQRWRTDQTLARGIDIEQYVRTSEELVDRILTQPDRAMLTEYTDKGFALYNPAIRAGLMEATEYAAAIDQLIAGGLDVKARVFRGLSDHSLIAEGALYVDRAPGSASVTMDRALELAQGAQDTTGIVLHMFGARAANISGLSVAQEAEALVRPDERFRVLLKVRDPKAGVYHAVLAREGGGAPAPRDGAAAGGSSRPRPERSDAASSYAGSDHDSLYIKDD